MVPYKKIEQTLTVVREQLALFKVKQGIATSTVQRIEPQDWDFARADTKTETHCFHPYPAMMIPQIARSLIHLYGKEGQTLLDPFCGSGTALVEARIYGLNSYGIDINPLALLLSRVKTSILDINKLKNTSIKLCNDYLEAVEQISKHGYSVPIPDFFNLNYWFNPNVTNELAILRTIILRLRNIFIREFFLVCFSETVRNSSYTRNGEFKLFRIPEEQLHNYKPNVPQFFFDAVQKNLKGMSDYVQKASTKNFATILDEDSRTKTSIPSKSIDIVVTSPPYGDSRTTVAYGQFSRLSLQWLGFPWEKVKGIDTDSLGGKRIVNFNGHFKDTLLIQTINEVALQDVKRAQDVASFFYDLELCLKELNRVCKKGAIVCFVVGNRTVKGIRISSDEIVSSLGAIHGFRFLTTYSRNIPNKRMPSKNSPTNIVGKLGETMTKEHIVILEKINEINHG